MSDLLAGLDAYPDLPPDGRAAVERDVAAADDPDLDAALRDARALAALLGAAAPSPALDVARHLVARRLGHATDDASVRTALDANPALRTEAARVGARLDALAETMEDPAAQFERLTGHLLAPERAAPDRAAEAPARTARVSRMRWARGLAAALVVVLIAYSGLAAVSSLTVSEAARVADLDAALDYRTPTLRGGGEATGDLGAPLAEALDRLAEARSTTLGFFPRYPDEALTAATEDVATIAERAPDASGVQQEALMSLARIQLHAERYPEAAATLRRIAELGSYDAPEARRLLDFVAAQPAQ